MFNLNKIDRKTLFIANVITIICLIVATGFFIYEIYLMEEHGGNCVRNPLNWAEEWAYKEKGLSVKCECHSRDTNFSFFQLNISEVFDNERNS